MNKIGKERTYCPHCVMPIIKDRVEIEENGSCNLCNKHKDVQRKKAGKEKAGDINQLMELIHSKKQVNKDGYDCVVSVSGGKDSLSTMYVAKKQLNLNPLCVMIDNGFISKELLDNAHRAAEKFDVKLVIVKNEEIPKLFRKILLTKKPFYYCHVCHTLIDFQVRKFARDNGLNVVLGGFTKGQSFFKQTELAWIFKQTDEVIKEELDEEFAEIKKMFSNLVMYSYRNYNDIALISPFQYIQWSEEQMIQFLKEEIGFVTPEKSWPQGSSNCLFNYISQYLAERDFGYSQHEVELSTLIRNKELSRERAVEIINTPILEEDLRDALALLDLRYEDVF